MLNTYGLEFLRISDSTMNSYHSCARKLEFRKFYKYDADESVDQNIAGPVGTAIHCGYQEWLASNDRDKAVWQMMLNYPVHLDVRGKHERSIYAAYASLMALIDSASLVEYEVANITLADGTVKPAIEVPFFIEIENFSLSDDEHVPVIFAGKIDAILYSAIDGSYIVTDIKTHRDNMGDLSAKYANSNQCLPYGLVLSNLLGLELDGFMVKYLSVYVDLINPKVQVYDFHKDTNIIEDWARGLAVDLQNIKLFMRNEWFPRDGSSCMNWRRKCEFFDICPTRDTEKIKRMIAMGADQLAHKVDHFGEPWITMKLDIGFGG